MACIMAFSWPCHFAWRIRRRFKWHSSKVAFDVGEDSSDDAEQADTAEAIVNSTASDDLRRFRSSLSVALRDTVRASVQARSLNTRRHGPGTAMTAARDSALLSRTDVSLLRTTCVIAARRTCRLPTVVRCLSPAHQEGSLMQAIRWNTSFPGRNF